MSDDHTAGQAGHDARYVWSARMQSGIHKVRYISERDKYDQSSRYSR
jgi:hypothetical protein